MILQHRQVRTLVLAIGLPRAGLDTLTQVGVRCMKEVVVVKVRVRSGGGGSSGRRRLQPHQGPAPVKDEISSSESSRVVQHGLNAQAENAKGLLKGLADVVLEVLHRHVPRNEGTELAELRRELAEAAKRRAYLPKTNFWDTPRRNHSAIL